MAFLSASISALLLSLAWGQTPLPLPFRPTPKLLFGVEPTRATEPYSARPRIEQVRPREHSLGAEWEALKQAHVEAVAQFLESYPDHEIYFLARDSELLHDLAVLATQENPLQRNRIHLLNASTLNVEDTNFINYLAQEGISESALKAGKKFAFIDTGFKGSIPIKIEGKFPPQYRDQFSTHLLVSENFRFPSSRVFINQLSKEGPKNLFPYESRRLLEAYEEMPRFSERSTQIAKHNGRWEAMSVPAAYIENHNEKGTDGIVSRAKALTYMEDMAAYYQRTDVKSKLNNRRSLWRKLHELMHDSKRDDAEITETLKRFISQSEDKEEVIPIVRDFLEMRKLQVAKSGVIDPLKLGISREASRPSAYDLIRSGKFNALLGAGELIDQSDFGVSHLIKNNNWSALSEVTDLLLTTRESNLFSVTLATVLAYSEPNEGKRQFIQSLLSRNNRELNLAIAKNLLPRWIPEPEWAATLIEQGNDATRNALVVHTFSRPQWAPYPALKSAALAGSPVEREKWLKTWRDSVSGPVEVIHFPKKTKASGGCLSRFLSFISE